MYKIIANSSSINHWKVFQYYGENIYQIRVLMLKLFTLLTTNLHKGKVCESLKLI